jgi:hypothetical protein
MPEQSAAYMFNILDNIHEYGTEFPYCNPRNYYRVMVTNTTPSSPRSRLSEPRGGPRFTTVKLGRLDLTEGALKLRLDTG